MVNSLWWTLPAVFVLSAVMGNPDVPGRIQDMPFDAQTFRVLIASPSDLLEEREAATDVINDWNVQHAAAEGVVLLPVKWETHAIPTAGIRPQEVINCQLVKTSDVLVGMFWTKLGTSTGVAESGTVEEIEQFVAAGKPAMLYFSSRPIDPNKIDLKQHKKLKQFKVPTYKKALVGGFSSVAELRATLLRDLTNQVRQMKKPKAVAGALKKLEVEKQLTEVLILRRANKIAPEEVRQLRDELLGGAKRTRAQTTDPVISGQKGPNGHPIGYTKEGDKVEFVPDDENPGEVWPLVLRRNDNIILEAYKDFWDVVWWRRGMAGAERDRDAGKPDLAHEEFLHAHVKNVRRIERKYDLKKLHDPFEWGLLSGRMSALSWVMGSEWHESLDT
jgi:hypothetical protein